MNILSLIIPGNPPSVNHMYRNHVVNGRAMKVVSKEGLQWKKDVQNLATIAARQQKWERSHDEKLVAEVTVYWPTKRKRDVENIGKLLWDSLEGIVFENDQWLLPRYMDFHHDKDNPRVEIKFYPLEARGNRVEQPSLAI